MPSKIFMILGLLAAALLLAASPAPAADILGPSVTLNSDTIYVSTGLSLDDKHLSEIQNGVSKEIVFYVDLFRVWRMWPDEFILGKTLTQTLRCDPVKKEYVATSLKGTTLTEKRFSDCRPLLSWALTVNRLPLTRTTELEPSMYFVKVTVESRLRRLPPVINTLFFFVREKEFSMDKMTVPFPVHGRRP